MSIDPSKVCALAVLALPLAFWFAIYWAARWWSINWRPILPWLKSLRWVSWGCGTAMVLIPLARRVFPLGYGVIMLGFAAGLALVEGWVKRRFSDSLNSN